jgi:hypothetical protein
MPDETDAALARRDLIEFLNDLRDLFDVLLLERPEWFGFWHASLLEAWTADVKPAVEAARAELERTTPSPSRLDPAEIDDRLRAHGLTGVQLRLKLDQFRAAARALLDEIVSADEAERYWRTWLARLRGSRPARWISSRLESVRASNRRIVQSKLGRCLRIANNILESLGDAVPVVGPVAVKAIKEFKDALGIAAEGPEEIAKARKPPPTSIESLRSRFGSH